MATLAISRNQRGSAAVEACASLLGLVTLAATIGLTLVISISRVWVHHALYEGLICVAEENSITSCEKTTKRKVENLLMFARVQNLSLASPWQKLKLLQRGLGKGRQPQEFKGSLDLAIGRTSDPNRVPFHYELTLENPRLKAEARSARHSSARDLRLPTNSRSISPLFSFKGFQ